MKSLDVVAGLIVRETQLLVCQRRESASFPLKWEFPGGKVERGENHEAALRRELNEELGIIVEQMTEIWRHKHQYSQDLTVSLRFYRVRSYSGEVRNVAFQQLRWASIDDLRILDFLDGDLPLLERLLTQDGRQLLA